MPKNQKILILIGLVLLAYIIIFLLAPKDITDYTVVDTEYWRQTENRLLIKTAYEYNDKEQIKDFPKTLGDWKGFDFRYNEQVYKVLNADILLTRAYTRNLTSPIYLDIINSKTGESFHKQNICVKGAGWNIDNDSIAQFNIADLPNPFTKLYSNRLDISKGNQSQIMLYWFMFKKFGSKDAVTMLRLTSPVLNDDKDATYNSLKDFVENQLFEAIYKGTEKEEITNEEYIIKEYGNKGLYAMMIGIILPIGMILIGIREFKIK